MAEKNLDIGCLSPYFSNLDDQVFVVKNLSGMTGAVMARYSRTQSGLRETLLREFVAQDQLQVDKASELIERVLIAFGDDSVGELEGAHLSFEGISLLATKAIEHRRIGGSPIEQSTRYVRFDFKTEDGRFRYQVPPALVGTALESRYCRDMDRIFTGYGRMWKPLKAHLERKKPLTEAKYLVRNQGPELFSAMETDRQMADFKRTYRMDIKTKTCDVLRAYLPLATQANVGLFGNGRFFQHLISKMLSSPLQEVNALGQKAYDELSTVIPHYVKRAKRSPYMVETPARMAEVYARYFGDVSGSIAPGITSITPDFGAMAEALNRLPSVTPQALDAIHTRDGDLNFVTALVFAYGRAPFVALRERVKSLPSEAIEEIMDATYGHRTTRRDRPERAIEFGTPHTFELVTEWGVYKDLMRHRMGTMLVQPLIPDMGFKMPEEIEEAGLAELGRDVVSAAESLHRALAESVPEDQSYAFLQGHYMRWLLGMNDRALMHMLELRTGVQGHPNYRKACQAIHRLLNQRHPQRAARMNFVNYEEVFWSRSDSEAKQRRDEANMETRGDTSS